MITLPYRKFVRYCISQGRSLEEIRQIFMDRPPFARPQLDELKEIYYDLLKEVDEQSNEDYTINSKPLKKINSDILPADSSPVLLSNNPADKALAKKTGLYDMWGAMINDKTITDMDDDRMRNTKKAYTVFEEMSTPKLHICILKLAGYDAGRIKELINERFELNLTKESLKIFFDYFWPVDDIPWHKLEQYIETLIARNKTGKTVQRLFNWALNGDLVQLTYKLDYDLKTMDEVEMMQDIVMGEYIEMMEHYQGREDVNAYERNKIASTMRQAYLFAKGYRELTGKESPEDIESELVNPEKADLDGFEDEEDFEEENIIEPDMEDAEELKEGDEDDLDDE